MLALTDRDGLYGAVKFAKACLTAGVRPVSGWTSPIAPTGRDCRGRSRGPGARRTPVRGGSSVDPRHARVLVLARGKPGWAALNRLVSATHLGGERGQPVTTLELVAAHAAGGAPHGAARAVRPSSAGRWRRAVPTWPTRCSSAWRAVVDPAQLVVEVVSHHGGADGDPAALSGVLAARMLGFAREHGLPAVLTNAVRYADRDQAVTADVLDAARRLVALDLRHVDRPNAEGHLKSGDADGPGRRRGRRLAGLGDGPTAARRLLDDHPGARRAVRARPVRRPGSGRGVPPRARGGPAGRPGAGGTGGALDAVAGQALLRRRCEGGARHAVRRRRRDATSWTGSTPSSTSSAQLGYATYFLTVADVVDLIRDMGVRVAARGSGAGSLVNYLLGISGVDPLRPRPADGAVPVTAAPRAARHRRRRRVGPPYRGLRADPRSASAASAARASR